MSRPVTWFGTPFPLLKLAQIACLLLIVVFFIDGRQQWAPYTLVFVAALLTVMANLILLMLHYFDVERTAEGIPWCTIEIVFNAIAFVFYLAAALILAWDWWQLNGGSNRHHHRTAPKNIGEKPWQRRVAIVSAVSCVAAVLFLITLARVRRNGTN